MIKKWLQKRVNFDNYLKLKLNKNVSIILFAAKCNFLLISCLNMSLLI